jgi:glycosyltransferase A (GT-A) superfamily protein (DUF2064 family)
MTRTAIILFSRRWETEALAKFGPHCSTDARRAVAAMVHTVLASARSTGVDVIWCTDAVPDERTLADMVVRHVMVQRGASLRERIIAAFAEAFDLGYDRLCLVAGDTLLRASTVQKALVGDDVVLGPSLDGGFYLLAASDMSDVRCVLAAHRWNNGCLRLQRVAHRRLDAEPDFDTALALVQHHPSDVVRATAAKALLRAAKVSDEDPGHPFTPYAWHFAGRAPPFVWG